MRRLLAVAAVPLVVLSGSSLFCSPLLAQKRLSYEDVRKGIRWESAAPRARLVAGGRYVEIGKRWIDPATGKEVKSEAEPAAAAGKRTIAFEYKGELWSDEIAGPAARRFRGRRMAPSKNSRNRGKVDLARGAISEVHVSGDGSYISYVQHNDLHLVGGGDVWRVTEDGGPELFHGKLDWVYQEELYGRGDFQAHWWSPKGGRCAFLSLDEAPVREFTVIDHVPQDFLDKERSVVSEVTNYPKAGDPNPFASLSVAHMDSGKVVKCDLSRFPKDLLVVRVDWTPDGETLLATIQDRIQTWAELCAIDPKTGEATTWIREESPTWVNRPSSPRWLADGTFLWLSERTGYQHVYHYQKGGKLIETPTSGEWQVRSIVRVDEQKKLLWFEGTKDGATGRHLYRVAFDGSGLVCLTPGVGTHSFSLGDDGRYVLDRWSSMEHPTIVRVCDGQTGEAVRELGRAGKGAAKDYAFSEKKRLSIPARDGYPLDASVQLPPDWQSGKRYPIFLPTYSGPDAPSVRDRWSHSTYYQFLAQQGFIVLQCNVRSASGRGQQHTGTCYRQLGVQELKDLEDAVDHVCKHFGGNPDKVAISGWSYGGFMSAYALTHSKKFALGLAGAGVHDWRLYDTIYTERYMRTPQENQQGYDATSVVKAAKNLHGHLVLIHGTKDDNVHMQNTMQLLWELQKANRQNVELMVYPRSRHGLNGQVRQHSSEFQWRRLQKLLDE
ncbi:MAG: DPP IV N-terminal domain-containing protein [Planctomycetota bacterium]